MTTCLETVNVIHTSVLRVEAE